MAKTSRPFRTTTSSSSYWEKRITQNELYAQRLIDKAIDIREVKLKETYNNLKASIQDLYFDLQDRGFSTITRTELYQYQKWDNLSRLIESEFKDLTLGQNEEFEKVLNSIYEDTFNRTIKDVLPDSSTKFSFLSEDQMKQGFNSKWSGKDFKTLGKEGNDAVARKMQESIEKLITEGANPSRLTKEIMDELNVSHGKASRLVRTEGSFAFNSANLEAYRNAGVARIEVLVEDDACEECLELLKHNEGVYDASDVPQIPAHPNCRCAVSPKIDVPNRD